MGDAALTEAYNAAVDGLRRFRDAHLRIVALYIVGPSHRGAPTSAPAAPAGVCAGQLGIEAENGGALPGLLRGTGGTDMVKFLKGVRDRTSEAAFPLDCGAQ
jgi:indoleamine 2,3-dioxygenase